jgi:hypothetical protein
MNYQITKNFTNKKLKKIVNVFQLDYINGKSPGLGDFIRGSFCFMQLAQLLNLEFEIDISNHPISKYVKFNSKVEGLDYKNITIYSNHNYNWDPLTTKMYDENSVNITPEFLDKTINWLNSQDVETLGFFSNAHPFFYKHTEYGKKLINSKLQPNKLMNVYIDKELRELGLSKKTYGVIHIRTGDDYLLNKKVMSKEFINKIKNALNRFIVPERKYLILSDSTYLKNILKTYPNFYISIKNIEHLGGESINKNNSEGIINTLTDYYLMSYSNAIICLSVYGHISGFSKYCSVLNNIPYKSYNDLVE